MSKITILGALALAIATTACSHTAAGAKQDTKVIAEKTGDAAVAAARKTDEGVQTGQVKMALMADSRVDAGDINVDTHNDTKTVILKGTVPTDEQRTIAAQIAQDKAKSYRIVNELTVRKK